MHLMIPHASAVGEAATHTLAELSLPNLAQLLPLLSPVGATLGSDEYSFNTPFELALSELRGCHAQDGCLPTAAWALQAKQSCKGEAWALLTPIHLSVGSDQITALPPQALALTEAESRAFFESLSELWPAAEGWISHWLGSHQWLVAHASFAGLRSASLERVLHRNVDIWMPQARRLRTLQNETQMLLHGHPLNEAREAAGALALNSVWISGCGVNSGGQLPADLQIEAALQLPLLAGDWQAWSHAWVQLDDGPVAALLAQARRGETPLRLTLCGERHARTWALKPRSRLARLWQAMLPPRSDTANCLGGL
ncbi:hypothetical protein [Roseateles oligotrophus]|uniref:Cofactor-independent phosphoglycerate mutase n=1 Tax=Roseateles oligotrophus TaxID=1769250 RepID=A0ABT2YC52_9BURK|nr:hypothetical protein [Roseateles oligotrophus]MCV2367619.1 hypothetical protein [Roseateles oligotrophus]